jgi:AP-1 complex subunit beta-1
MEIDFFNKALVPMNNFAIQINKNSFGLAIVDNLQIGLVLQASQNTHVSVLLSTNGIVSKMEPLNLLQVRL